MPPKPKSPEDTVRCLACGSVYALPMRADADAGCPDCGAVSWIAVELAPPPRGTRALRATRVS